MLDLEPLAKLVALLVGAISVARFFWSAADFFISAKKDIGALTRAVTKLEGLLEAFATAQSALTIRVVRLETIVDEQSDR